MPNQPIADQYSKGPRRLQIAVIGCGAMGRNHARLCSELKGVELALIIDPDEERRERARNYFQCPVAADLSVADLSQVDACCVAAPTGDHFAIAHKLLGMKKPCLVEKPLAEDPVSCRKLVELQNKVGVPVLVGHIERFNPAFIQLEQILHHETLVGLDIQRLSYNRLREQSVDVVMDLMIHDIDIVLALLGDDPIDHVHALGVCQGGEKVDYAVAVLRSETGRVVTLTASRLTHNKLRLLQATTKDSHIQVDYTDQKIDIHRKGRIHVADEEVDPHYIIETSVEKVVVRHNEPLANELRHFFACVRGQETPQVTTHDALRTIETAQKIQAKIYEHPVAQTTPIRLAH